MRQFLFSPEDVAAIRHDRFNHPHPRVQRKMEVLWLKSQGLGLADVAHLADVSERSAQRYLDAFDRGGLDRIRQLNWAGRSSPLDEHRQSLEEHFVDHPPRSLRHAQADIERLTQIRRGLSQVRVFLKTKVGLSWRKVGTIPAKADPVAQATYLKDKLRPRLREAELGLRNVLFVDAAHFVYGPFLSYLWCLVRLVIPGPSGRKRYNVLAALDAITHRVIRVTNHAYINAESVCELLRQIAVAGLSGPITLVLDNARYQHCAVVKALAESLKIELLFLPSYSPNLNLIERVWKFVKKECLGARVLPSYEAFTAAIDDCLDKLSTTYKSDMKTLLTLNFQTFENATILTA